MRIWCKFFAFTRSIAGALVLILGVAGSVAAGPFEDGVAAYNRQDYASAMRSFRAAADQGNATARSNLGYMYERGQGLPAPNFEDAARWYRLAADQGHARAQVNLGLMYYKGLGVEQNNLLAYAWFNRAAAGASDDAVRGQAVTARDLVVKAMTPAQLAEAQAQAHAQAQAPVGASPPQRAPQSRFDAAVGLMKTGRYADAEQAFRNFIQANPQDPLAASAQYWLAETYFIRNIYAEAAEQFMKGYQRYPQGPMAPNTLVKLGLSLASLGRNPEACVAFGSVNGRYPEAPRELKDQAEQERRRLACQGPPIPAAPQASASASPLSDPVHVARIQQSLATTGYYKSTVDGLYGPGTEVAIKAWQQARGQAATGSLTEAQLEQLRSDHARIAEAQRSAITPVSKAQDARPAAAPGYTTAQASTASTVKLIREGGTFKVPALVNGVLPLQFTVDSGASDVSIPADVVLTLHRTGTITDSDYMGERTYMLADGSKVKSKLFRIRQLKVGDMTVENVLANVANVKGPLLLGQSFLSRFKKVSFDYGQGLLTLE